MVAAHETTLRELLEGAKQYRVPLYQRTYSWKADQREQLWRDILALAEERVDDPTVTHFIGSLVLAPGSGNGPTGVSEYLVVDGQQRLTTLSILLCAIRDHRSEHEGPGHRERVSQQYLINPWRPEGQRLKLVPTQADRDAYLACVDDTPQAGGSDRIGEAYRYFAGELAASRDSEEPLDVERLEDTVISGLALVSITAQAGDNVYRIFESLNNTGLQLTQADLLRNYLFMRLPKRGETVYRSLWLPLQKQLDREDLELLFWLDLVHRDPRVKQTDTYSGQQARLGRLHGEKQIEDEVRRFSRLGTLLRTIMNPTEEKDPGVRKRLDRLKVWGTTTVYPLLLHLLDRRDQGTATSEQIARAMLYVESFFVRRLLIGRATANINRILLTAVTDMNREIPVDEAVRAHLSAGRKYYATNASVRAAVRTMPYYLNGRAHQRSLVLRWLEESYDSKEPVVTDKLTIEHVMPQKPTAEWRKMLGEDLTADEDFTEAYEALVHTLGNLTLTGYNSEMGNSPFPVKRVQLRNSGVSLNQDIANQKRWGRPEIHARADALAEQIIATWPGPTTSGGGEQTEAPWEVMNRALAQLPTGSWTTYGDVAALIGSHSVPVGRRLATHSAPNAHRVLQVDGTLSPNFRWPGPERSDDPRDLLREEGVQFDPAGRANPAQRIGTEELAQLAGITEALSEGMRRARPGQGGHLDEQFVQQLTDLQGPDVLQATRTVLDAWTSLGGTLLYGGGGETSCFLMARGKEHELGNIWPAAIYPSGKFEIVFQHLSNRTPFDDLALREEFRQRLNELPGVDIAAARIALRPGFPLTVLTDTKARDGLIDHLDWFYRQARTPAP